MGRRNGMLRFAPAGKRKAPVRLKTASGGTPMSGRKSKGRLPPFVPVLKDTIKTEAWKAASHGARSLYVTLKSRYNTRLQNSVYLSSRDAEKELGAGSDRKNVLRWFRELAHYGFIVMVSPAHHGVNSHGKAPHWRLTEEWYLGKAPTRDFLNWDGKPFSEPKRAARYHTLKNKVRGGNASPTLGVMRPPFPRRSEAESGTSGGNASPISGDGAGGDASPITSSTTGYADTRLAEGKPAVPIRELRKLFQRPAVRPDKFANAAYLAAWYQIPEQHNLPAAA